MDASFDPDAPATKGLFGLPHAASEAGVIVLPVPFEATASFGIGTSGAPDAIAAASLQVDLSDPQTGEPWRAGIVMAATPAWVAPLNAATRVDVDAARADADGVDPDIPAAAMARLERIERAGERIAELTESWTEATLNTGQIPAILGGDHSVPLGAFRAAARRFPGLGILQIDAHADLREAYEGFAHSHASIIFNARAIPTLGPIIQVGLRDVGVTERALADADPRLHWWTDTNIAARLHRGVPFRDIATAIVAQLPETVWISFDVDGLDPALCPGTGTPVPGGLSWREAMTLLEVLGTSGKRLVGFDICEVGAGAWDANIGARLLYKLAGWALSTQSEAPQ